MYGLVHLHPVVCVVQTCIKRMYIRVYERFVVCVWLCTLTPKEEVKHTEMEGKRNNCVNLYLDEIAEAK